MRKKEDLQQPELPNNIIFLDDPVPDEKLTIKRITRRFIYYHPVQDVYRGSVCYTRGDMALSLNWPVSGVVEATGHSPVVSLPLTNNITRNNELTKIGQRRMMSLINRLIALVEKASENQERLRNILSELGPWLAQTNGSFYLSELSDEILEMLIRLEELTGRTLVCCDQVYRLTRNLRSLIDHQK